MVQMCVAAAMAIHFTIAKQSVPVQFGKSYLGRNVTVLLDGRQLKSTFAGKLAFRDDKGSWLSVCADVRRPIIQRQTTRVMPRESSRVGGHVTLAGNIVARYFKSAQTADQCAGLQLAVWEALEDGGVVANFGSGKFQASANAASLNWAAQYYQAIETPGNALYLDTTPTGPQPQLVAL